MELAIGSRLREAASGVARRLGAASPRQLLLAAWGGFLVYAYPGYMSYDSMFQLRESRFGVFGDNHPPALAALWRVVELFIAGPFGMLLIQSGTFLVGLYLVLRDRMSPRAGAIAAGLVLWFPPVSSVMAVIWKDSQMTGFLMLGFGLLLSERRRVRVAGLAFLTVATAMRYNALFATFPIVLVCFVWNPQHRFWKRHLIAFGAWIGITASAQLVTLALTDEKRHYWHINVALCDMIGTLRHMPDISDRELHQIFDGIVLRNDRDIQARARGDAPLPLFENLQRQTFATPRTQEQRDAVTRAWKTIVLGNKSAYLDYRIEVFRGILGLDPRTEGSPVYTWFNDIQDPFVSAAFLDHDANPGKIQDGLRGFMTAAGESIMFRIMLYVALCFVLLPFALRDRIVLALLASAIASELVLFVIAPTTDWRYSFWLITASVIALILVIARRASRRLEPKEAA